MSGKFGIHSPRAYPKLSPRTTSFTGAAASAYGIGLDRNGLLFTYDPVTTYNFWPEWAGIPSPGLASFGDPFEVRLDVISGLAPTFGTLATWLALTSNRQWERFPAIGANVGVWRISLRRVFAGTDALAIADFTFSITRI